MNRETKPELKLLVVTPNPEVVRLFKEIAKQVMETELDIEIIENLKAALLRLEAGGIDIILADLNLPDSQGVDTFLKLKDRFSVIPIIVLAGLDEAELAMEAIRAGAQDFLIRKNLESGLLLRSVKYSLEKFKVLDELKKKTQKLEINEESLNTIVEKNEDGIIIVDQVGIVLFINPAAVRILGRTSEDLLGNMIGLPLISGESTELNIIRKGREQSIAETRVVETVWKDRKVYLASLRDITERKKTEEIIASQQLKLEAAYNQLTRELEQARQAQIALLPQVLPKLPKIELAAVYHPMKAIGGDFYDLVCDDNENLGMLVGDVTGHGISAALLSFLYLTTFKNSHFKTSSPDALFRQSNAFLVGKLPLGKYASIFFCTYNLKNRMLSFSSAGHPPAFLIRAGSEKIICLQTPGLVVGMFENPAIPFESKSIELLPGDKVLIYTDGLLEVFNENKQMLDTNTFEKFLISNNRQPIDQLLQLAYEFCSAYAGHRGFEDDVTLIGLEVC
jgi:phosphoserine phosphatase RsbU/P